MNNITITDIGEIFKDDVEPQIQDMMKREAAWYNTLRGKSGIKTLANNQFTMKLRTGGFQSISTAPGGTLRPTKPKFSHTTVDCKWTFATFDIDDPTMTAARKSKGVLTDILTDSRENLAVDMRRNMARVFASDGSAKLATADGAAAGGNSTSLTLHNSTLGDIAGTAHLVPNMFIKIGAGTAVEIVSVDSDTQVTLAENRNWADNAIVYNVDGDGAVCDEPDGILSGIDNGVVAATFQAVNRALVPWFSSYVYSPQAAEDINLKEMRRADRMARKFGDPGLIVMNGSLLDRYGAKQEDKQRFAPSEKLMTGWPGLDFMGGKAEIHGDDNFPDDQIFGIDPKSMAIAELEAMGFVEGTNGVLNYRIDKASWQVTMKYYCNYFMKNPQANWVMRNQKDTP